MALSYTSPRQYKQISRYSIYRQITDSSESVTYLESANDIKIHSSTSKYHVVEPGEQNRLDIISRKYYGTPTLYWAIAMVNNIIDPTIVVAGSVLEIPSYESLYENGGPLIRRG